MPKSESTARRPACCHLDEPRPGRPKASIRPLAAAKRNRSPLGTSGLLVVQRAVWGGAIETPACSYKAAARTLSETLPCAGLLGPGQFLAKVNRLQGHPGCGRLPVPLQFGQGAPE
jgi:hypothetical protein